MSESRTTATDPDGIDWPALHAEAVRMAGLAYAPYSRFAVGVAGLVDDGRVVSGCNVENAAFGATLCAECGMVSQLHATGAMARLGTRAPGSPTFDLHQGDLVVDEDAVALGARLLASVAVLRRSGSGDHRPLEAT